MIFSKSKNNILTWAVIILSLHALAFLLFNLSLDDLKTESSPHVFWRAFAFTVYQAFLSSFFSVAIGLMAAPGYSKLGKGRRFTRWIFLLPNLMSSVLVVLCLLLTFPNYPYGIWGIVLGHIFINAGLCTVWLGERWSSLEDQWKPITKVMGITSARHNFKIILPLMASQIKNTFAVVFSFCLASFAIPLVLGGGPHASTLEVLIYEYIQTDANVSVAAGLGVVQCVIQILVFTLVLRSSKISEEFRRTSYLKSEISLWLLGPLLVAAISILPLVPLFKMAVSNLSLETFNPNFISSTILSFKVSAVIFVSTFVLLSLLLTYGWSAFLLKVPTVSGVVVGLSGILLFKLGGNTSDLTFCVVLIWAQMSIIFLPVFRLSSPSLESMRFRFEKVFDQLGTSAKTKYEGVYFPLGFKTLFAGSGLAACWSIGDFSVARTLGFTQNTLPVYVQNLMSSYRLEQAAASSLLLMVLTLVSLILLEVLSGVLG